MKTPTKYFAAANGYSGFRSYFDTVFDSKDFDKIYVLKGGPGTGKSNLMKMLSSKLLDAEVLSEHIYCSSDPESLDGVIFEKDGRRAAIIDGTAPHERDARIPGAIDEIIDLGKNWDSRWLSAKKEQILELNKEKKRAYKTAYSYLSIAGTANEKASEFFRPSCNANLLNMLSKSLADHKSEYSETKTATRLISSFGKGGRVKLDTLESGEYRQYSLVGDEEAAYIFLNEFYKAERLHHSKIIRFPTPLDDRKTEAILFPDEELVYTVGGNGEAIDTESFTSLSRVDKERIKSMKRIEEEALEESKRWFAVASELHFSLEEIYSKSMNFDKNDIILKEKSAELFELFKV